MDLSNEILFLIGMMKGYDPKVLAESQELINEALCLQQKAINLLQDLYYKMKESGDIRPEILSELTIEDQISLIENFDEIEELRNSINSRN